MALHELGFFHLILLAQKGIAHAGGAVGWDANRQSMEIKGITVPGNMTRDTAAS